MKCDGIFTKINKIYCQELGVAKYFKADIEENL